MSEIERARHAGWKVFKADQSQFNLHPKEAIWSIQDPSGRIHDLSCSLSDTEASVWEHALRFWINH